MITASDEFKALWHKKNGLEERIRIGYKRRYWNGSAFVNEASFTFLDKPDFVGIGTIAQSLDVPKQNSFRVATASFRFENRYNQWLETTAHPSIFAIDATATLGYRVYRTIFQVQYGLKLSDGTFEYLAVFTGLAMKPKIKGRSSIATIPVKGFMHKLESADAENVSDTFTLENCIPATGDASNVDFESTSIGVDYLTDLQVNAVSDTKGSVYKVSNRNSVVEAGNNGRAAIVRSSAPGNALTVKCSGVKWKQDNLLETLLGLLFDEAGVLAANRQIDPITFPGGVSGSKTMDSQTNWEAGTVTQNISTITPAGSIRALWTVIETFADGDWSATPAWSLGPSGTYTVTANVGKITNEQVADAGASTATLKYFDPSKSPEARSVTFTAAITDNSGAMVISVKAFTLTIGAFGIVFRSDGNAYFFEDGGSDHINLGAWSGSQDEYRITRTAANVFEVWLNGVSKGTYDAGAGSMVSTFVSISVKSGTDNLEDSLEIDDIYWSTESIDTAGPLTTAHLFESEEFDLLAAPTSWGTLDITEVLNSGTIAYATDVSASSGSGFDGYVAIGAGNIIASNLKRYLKVRAIITPLVGGFGSPEVQKLVANFSSTQVFVSLAIHAGKTCLQKSIEYVGLGDYELAEGGDGKIFVRSKTTSAEPAIELDQENGIIDVLDFDDGIPERVKNVGRVRHGEFVSVYDGTAASEASPTSEEEYGRRVQDENITTLLANDVNLATARAQVIFENRRRSTTNPKPPLRIRLKIWIVPWLQISDIIRVWFFDHPIMRRIQANDPLSTPGPYSSFGAPKNILSNAKDWKVLTYNPNYDNNTAEVLGEEI